MNSHSSASASSRETALVANATSSLGHELARELARHGHRLVIVGAIEPEVIAVASRLQSEFNVDVRPVALDLRKDGAADELFALLIAAGVGVEILVNIDGDERIVGRFLPAMAARGRGRILDLDRIAIAPDAENPDTPESTCAAGATGVTVTMLPREIFSGLDRGELATLSDRVLPTPQEITAAAYLALINGDRFRMPTSTSAIRSAEPAATSPEADPIGIEPPSTVAISVG